MIVRLGTVTSTQDVAREMPIGSVVVADHQTAGRGRSSHSWEAPSGAALLVSFVLPPNPLLSLAAGVAAAEACGRGVRLKWPNDLLLGGRKVGGILVEASPARAICGIGINLTWAPEGAAQLLARWRELSDTIGKKVRVELPDRIVEGTANDIDASGALVVDGVLVSAGSLIVLD